MGSNDTLLTARPRAGKLFRVAASTVEPAFVSRTHENTLRSDRKGLTEVAQEGMVVLVLMASTPAQGLSCSLDGRWCVAPCFRLQWYFSPS